MPGLFHWGRRKKRRFSDGLFPVSDRIAPGTAFRGTLQGRGNLLVCGEVHGNGEIDGGLVVAPGARWKGNVLAHRILIAGEVDGDVTALERLELAASARITGNLASPAIAIAEGAVHEGQIRAPKKSQLTRFSERRGRDERR